MIRTRVGYCGGQKQEPTYHDMGDQTESIQIDYDPSKVSYRQLLEVFWGGHNPCTKSYSRQYMTAVWTMSDDQKRIALETKADQETKRGATIHTQILPITKFWMAEDYHQKYYLRQDRELMREFDRLYPDWQDFTNSTAAARANAAVGKDLDRAGLDKVRDRLGLSAAAIKRLEGYAR